MIIPEEAIAAAIDAAYEADLHFARTRRPDGTCWTNVQAAQVRRLVEGAAPVIAAAERERIADLLLARIDALQSLLAYYRTGRNPTEKLFRQLERTAMAEEEIRQAIHVPGAPGAPAIPSGGIA